MGTGVIVGAGVGKVVGVGEGKGVTVGAVVGVGDGTGVTVGVGVGTGEGVGVGVGEAHATINVMTTATESETPLTKCLIQSPAYAQHGARPCSPPGGN